MHPSSFYDLRARYVYTSLHGPYSLSEALEGLISYSLDESRDSILIGSQRILHHALISELSNIIDDLQDYLLYFSSKFLILCSNSPNPVKELQASYNRFEHLSVCWGAIISWLVIARKIVECNFWPRFFQPSINELAALRRRKQPQSFVLPQVPLNNSSTTASTYISSSQIHTPACPADSPSQVQHLPLLNAQSEVQRLPLSNAQSEPPQTTPSKANPTVSKEDHPSSLMLYTSPTPSELHPTRFLSNCRPSIVSLGSPFLQVSEDCSNEDFVPLNHTTIVQHQYSSTPVHAGKTRELGNLEDNKKFVGPNEQATEEVEVVVEGEEVTDVQCIRSRPVSSLRSFTKAIPQPLARSSPSTTLPLSTTQIPVMTSPSSTASRLTSIT